MTNSLYRWVIVHESDPRLRKDARRLMVDTDCRSYGDLIRKLMRLYEAADDAQKREAGFQ